ncbi:hypothetical protein CWD94_14510 [Lysinibacillus xylanilyticus]|uniref:Uncharacterized protein n=1 Tax=Lysinibacillus xylanilyticus TaxID=582475 RepID=A0A2M9Q4I3_9BACI|nr:hypothetical protein CWD94_14510 [Lysinibacillus xylanilyticus]
MVYKAYGKDSFAQGELGGSMANVKPIKLEMLHFSSSPLILTICTNCGEVASMKVKKVYKFK